MAILSLRMLGVGALCLSALSCVSDSVSSSGWVIVTLLVALQPWSSVTVTE